MSEITGTRGSFFPKDSKTHVSKATRQVKALKRNDQDRAAELHEKTKADAKVQINDAVKDFSRIKKAVDHAPEIDNGDKIAKLKQQINAGTYNVDHDALAEKILEVEF